ncbi:methionyl-tRNA formyltransferase [uncultured Oscillibacter sp.]|uniref:methionyl-tRNA formyltransferase n=1 Tax=uncultured Oscillibacter sp. TaxID=876091 RepID=UPI0025F04C21|nr:methionyl-tRNA formyltransferase [uncultured Oscillibacter sp.]
MRILFMGTPDFAVASLRRLVEDGHTLCGVFTQPDKPKNRGHKLAFSPVKEYALSQNIPVYQPLKVRDGEALGIVETLAPELIVVAAYGRILPEDILSAPPYGSINVHSSLLPKYRGAAPINWAVLEGEAETGVSIMYMAKELDAGDVILQKTTPIGPEEDAQSLTERLAALGAEALSETVASLAAGTAARTPQDGAQATYASMLSREMSPVDWTRSAHAVACQVRGLIPWPCATTGVIGGETVKLYAVRETGADTAARPGTILAAGKPGIDIACGDGKVLRVLELQAQGGRRMSAAAYLLGHPIPV